MEAVRIMCQLSEAQISHLVNRVSSLLSPRVDEVSDIDEVMLMGSVRVCVDFSVDWQKNLVLLSAELLDRDWDVMDADSFAFTQYLQPVIDDYNRRGKEARQQHRQMGCLRRTFQPC